jgi:hypothetical protein
MAGRADARGMMDSNAEVAIVGDRGLTGVDAYPHARLGMVWPVVLSQCPLGCGSCHHCILRPRESGEQGVSLRVDFMPSLVINGRAKDTEMLR